MPNLQKENERESETTLRVAEFIGRNTYGQHSSLSPGEFRELQNYEIYPTYLKSRRGSQYLGTANNSNPIKNRIVWDIGDEEYLIYQQGTKLKYLRLVPSSGTKYNIKDLGGTEIDLTSDSRADLFLDGDKLFVMHEGGNLIIHWNADTSIFEARTLGLNYPYIKTITKGTGGTGGIVGNYIWGIELIYAPTDQSDISYSSPNRIKKDKRLARLQKCVATDIPTILLRANELDAFDWWTHLRLWRTLRLNTDNTDPVNPISAAGVSDQLFLVA